MAAFGFKLIKQPLYRRCKKGEHSGLKERVVWILNNGPLSGRELAEKVGVSLRILRDNLRPSNLEGGKTCRIAFTDMQRMPDGRLDRIYSLERAAKRITPKVTVRKQIMISKKSLHTNGEESKRLHEEQAARRRRLIKAGLYITESDLMK